MKKIIIFLLSILSLASANFGSWRNYPETLSWTYISNTPVACSNTAGVYLNGVFYQISGSNSLTTVYLFMQMYNGSSWSQGTIPHPSGGVSGHCAAVCNGKIVVSGGQTQGGSYYDHTSVYDPAIPSWVESTLMISNFTNSAMASVGGKCYLFGGAAGIYANANTYQWTPGDSVMIQKAPMPQGRMGLAAAEYNGKIYSFGGRLQVDSAPTNTIYEYNPSSNLWTTKNAHLINPRCYHAAVTIGSKIYIIGGWNWDAVLTSVEIYNPINDTISAGTPILYASESFAGAGYTTTTSNHTYAGTIYISGGRDYSSFLNHASKGIVTGVTYPNVEPRSLGCIKAAYR